MFDHLSSKEISQSAFPMYLPELNQDSDDPEACLMIRIASESNEDYNNAVLLRSGKKPRPIKRDRSKPSEERDIDLDATRADARATYPGTVVVDWKNVFNEAGEEVPWSIEVCQEFCQKMPVWIFDQILIYACTPENFLKAGEQLPPDGVELAKN